jgi:hypothetical protein
MGTQSDTLAEPRARLSRHALRWALEAIVCQHLTIARVTEALAVSWNTADDAVLTEGRRALIRDPHRLDGVQVIGVDEHAWRHTRRGTRTSRPDRADHTRANAQRRAADVLAHFDRAGTSNGPNEAINGRLEHLRAQEIGRRVGSGRWCS